MDRSADEHFVDEEAQERSSPSSHLLCLLLLRTIAQGHDRPNAKVQYDIF